MNPYTTTTPTSAPPKMLQCTNIAQNPDVKLQGQNNIEPLRYCRTRPVGGIFTKEIISKSGLK